MGNFSINGLKYRYLPSGAECIVLADFPNRHRVRIKLDNGREMDEVAYHDMASLTPAPAPVPAPAPASDPVVAEEAESEDTPRKGLTTPDRFRRHLRGE